MEKSFIEYLEEQYEVIENLIEQLKNGDGNQSISIFHLDLDRLNAWMNGSEEDLTWKGDD